MALTETEIRDAFTGLASRCDRLEALLDAHSPGRCVTADEITAVAVPGQTLTTTLSDTLEQVSRARSDPRFAAYPVQHLYDRLTSARDAWFLLCASHGFDPERVR